jgi:uncharacterized protein with GYD domain
MPIFIRLAHLTEKAHQNIRNIRTMAQEAQKIIEENGARVLHSYVTLGDYDIITILEAPDEKIAARISALILQQGNFRAETLPALSMEDFIKSVSGQ